MLWTLASSHGFEVKSDYKTLQTSEHGSFPWKSIWKVKTVPCITFFFWTATKDRILTIVNLKRRGFSLVNWYCLLIHYEYTSDL